VDVDVDVDVDVTMLVKWRDVRAPQSPTQFNLERTNVLEAFKVAVERGMMPSNLVIQPPVPSPVRVIDTLLMPT